MKRTPSCGGIFVTDCFLLLRFSLICFVFEISESDTESKKYDTHLSIGKPVVSDIQARSAVLSWNLPVSSQNGESHSHSPAAFTFEVAISNSGKNGKFKSVYV